MTLKRDYLPPYKVQEIFKKVYGERKNIITPHIVKYGCAGSYVYVLSYDAGENNEKLFGVSVLDRDTHEDYPPLNQIFSSRKQAEEHISAIRKLWGWEIITKIPNLSLISPQYLP